MAVDRPTRGGEGLVDLPARGLLGGGAHGGWKRSLECPAEFIHGEPRFAKERAKGSLGDVRMVRDDETSMRAFVMAQDDVASPLAVDLVSQALEGPDGLRTRDVGQFAQTATSTTSSSIDGGIGSS